MDISSLVSKMTLEEKAGLCSGLDFWHTKAVDRLKIPSVMVSDGPHGLRKQDQEGDHLGVNDSIKAVCFPAACATAASFDRDLIRRMGEQIGDSCQHEKLGVILGPAVNIKRSPLCGRNFEYYSEDPYLAGQMASSFIKGVQSRNIGTSIKHFAANNQEHRRMSSSSDVDERTLREIYFPAFETAVKEADPWTVMCSYNRINGIYASENEWLLTKVLRDEWGFEGFVMSDWGAVSDRVRGLAAGLELEMPSSNGINDRKIVEAVQNGSLDEKILDTACERILKIVYRYADNARPDTPWDLDAQDALSADIAAECAVLLKNQDNVLPLNKESSVAFIGEFARKPRYQGGGSSHINSFKVTGALEAAKGMDVIFAQGYEGVETNESLIREAAETARKASAAVVFAGLPDSFESEGYDRKHMRLPDSHIRLIEAVAAANNNTIVVLHNGSPVEMPWVDRVKGILEVYLGGQAVGRATVRLLYGDANPSGHLAESFPLKLSDNPSYLYYGGEGNVTEYREGVFVGYRYYDKKQMDVLFPFGHGLSYTSFEYSDLKVRGEGSQIFVTVTVTNTGCRAGKTVVQVYTGAVGGDVIRPYHELKGFEKVSLGPGESKEVSFVLDRRAFAYWETRIGNWHVPAGRYTIDVGDSSRHLPLHAEVALEGDKALPGNYDMNSIMMDIMTDPRGREIIKPLLARKMFGNDGDESDTAKDAISDEMGMAMMNYLPLRGLISFGGDEKTVRLIEDMLKSLNSQSVSGGSL